jgi:hypothetical protein
MSLATSKTPAPFDDPRRRTRSPSYRHAACAGERVTGSRCLGFRWSGRISRLLARIRHRVLWMLLQKTRSKPRQMMSQATSKTPAAFDDPRRRTRSPSYRHAACAGERVTGSRCLGFRWLGRISRLLARIRHCVLWMLLQKTRSKPRQMMSLAKSKTPAAFDDPRRRTRSPSYRHAACAGERVTGVRRLGFRWLGRISRLLARIRHRVLWMLLQKTRSNLRQMMSLATSTRPDSFDAFQRKRMRWRWEPFLAGNDLFRVDGFRYDPPRVTAPGR